MKTIAILIVLLFIPPLTAVCQIADLTLIPPSTITTKVDLDVRAGIVNTNAQNDLSCTAELYFDSAAEENLLLRQEILLPAGESVMLRRILPTFDKIGRHSIVLQVRYADGRISTERKDIRIIDSDIRSTRTIDGAWIGLYHWSELEGTHWNGDIAKLTSDDWRNVVRSMHEAGMDIIVLQELFRNQAYVGQHDLTTANYAGRAFYPSDLYRDRMNIACNDPVDAIMDEAATLGMNVFVGIGMFAWFDFSPESLKWHEAVTEEIWKRYGKYESFYGFYVSEECVGSLDNCESTEELRRTRQREIVDFFRNYKAFCSRIAPSKPIMLATNSMGVAGAEQCYTELLPNLDILCPFGFARMPKNDLSGYDAASLLQRLCNAAGSHLWFDLEAFLFNEDTSLYPRDFDGICGDLLMFDNFEKVLCYQYPGVFNNTHLHPLVGDKRGAKLYRDYKAYLSKIRERQNYNNRLRANRWK